MIAVDLTSASGRGCLADEFLTRKVEEVLPTEREGIPSHTKLLVAPARAVPEELPFLGALQRERSTRLIGEVTLARTEAASRIRMNIFPTFLAAVNVRFQVMRITRRSW